MEIFRTTAVASRFCVPLINAASMPNYLAAPSLSAGMVKVIRHTGGAWNVANITALPTAITGATTYLDVELTATELTSDNLAYPIVVQFIDTTSPKNFNDQSVVIWSLPVGVNALQINGTAQTARDIGASVLLSAGTGTGQLDFTSGVVKSNLVQILATALTETTGYLAAGFKQFFNIASPTSTMNTITTVSTATAIGANGITDASFASATYPKSIRTATAQNGAAGYIQLDASASSTDNLYKGCGVKIVSGTGAGQARTIILYTGSTQTAYVDALWSTNPDSSSVFVLQLGKITTDVVLTGIAAAAAASSITFPSTASSVSTFYDGDIIIIVSGTGAGQSRVCSGYVGSTKVASIVESWATTPDTTSVFVVRGLGAVGSNLSGTVPCNVLQWNSTNVATPATAGIPDVNVKNMNNVAATSITTIAANQGTTQPLNFTGTAASALVKTDVTDIATAAVNTASAQIGVNVVSTNNIDFTALEKTSLNAATPSVTVSDKTGFSLSTAGVLAIWNQLLSALTTASTVGYKIANWVLGSDSKVLLSSDTQTGVTIPTVTTVTGGATSATQTTILNAVNAITTNTSRSAPRVPDFMPRPVSSTATYEIDLLLYSLQGLSEDADSNTITVHARNSSGTSRDSGLSSTTMTRNSVGKYTVQYTVNYNDTAESVYFDFTWAVATVAMKDGAVTQVQDAESLATLLAVKTQTDKLTFDGLNNILSVKNATDLGTTDFNATEKASITAAATAATPSVTVSDKTGFSLTSGEETAIAGVVWASTVDGVAMSHIQELVMAMVNGKFVKDLPSSGYITFYKRNDSDVLTIVNDTSTQRTRSV